MSEQDLTPQQWAVIQRLRAGFTPAWLIVYQDGTTATLQDDGRSHAIRLPLVVPAEALA